jgi:hypothetical protein
MAVQSYTQDTECPQNENDGEPYPDGYSEALEDCHALAVNLLQKAINDTDVKRCWDCVSWCGRCVKGKINRIARSDACDDFEQRR